MLGTDHMEPSPYTSRAIAYANEQLASTQVIHSTIPVYIQKVLSQIESLEEGIPTIYGELRACDRMHLLPGVLSTRMWIKQRNHHSQNLLEKWAEPFSVFAEHMHGKTKGDHNFPETIGSNRIGNVAPILRQTWRLLMENHPHDSICGCSIDQVHDEMKPRFDQVDQIGEEIIRQALQTLVHDVNTQRGDAFSSIVIFNPLGNMQRGLVEVELNLPEGVTAFDLIDVYGNIVPHEFLGSSNEELANLLLPTKNLRDTIGAINEGRVAGAAIVSVKVSRQGATVTIDAVLDDHGQPNIPEWQRAEKAIAAHEADPSVTHFHVIAHTPQASKIRFVTPDIPALGWQSVWARVKDNPKAAPVAEVSPLIKPFLPFVLRFAQSELGGKVIAKLSTGNEQKPPFVIENEYFKVEASQTDGTLNITDKRNGAVFNGLNRFVDGGDAGDEYNYSPTFQDSFYSPKVLSLKVFRSGIAPSLEIEYALEIPAELSADRQTRSKKMVSAPMLSRICLAPGVPRIDIQTEIENLAKDHRLRVHFPAPFAVHEADHDGHFEVVRRPIGVPEKNENWVEDPRPEVPQRAFTDVSNGTIGLMLANRGLPEVEVIKAGDNQTEIALTLLRSVGWLSRDDMPIRKGHAGPGFETPGGQVPGKWHYEYSIIPHAGNWQEAYQHAYAFETTLRAIETSLHAGVISSKGSFVSHSPAEFVISAVKETEDGKGWLVRGYNISSEEIQLSLKTLRQFGNVEQVNLAEEKITTLKVESDGSVSIPVSAHQVVSIMFYDEVN